MKFQYLEYVTLVLKKNKTFQEVLQIYSRTTTLRNFSKIYLVIYLVIVICFSSTNMNIHHTSKCSQGINPKVCD